MTDFSKRALLEYLEASIAKGRVNLNTGGGIRAACKKILEQVGSEDDVRAIDVKAAVVQYNNRHPGELSGDSLRVYESRVRGVIENFVGSVTDPTGYRPASKQPAAKVKRTSDQRKMPEHTPKGTDGTEPELHPPSPKATVTETSLAIPFPLRPTFLAQIVIPRDMTKDEAKRLGAFIDALAHEPPT